MQHSLSILISGLDRHPIHVDPMGMDPMGVVPPMRWGVIRGRHGTNVKTNYDDSD